MDSRNFKHWRLADLLLKHHPNAFLKKDRNNTKYLPKQAVAVLNIAKSRESSEKRLKTIIRLFNQQNTHFLI